MSAVLLIHIVGAVVALVAGPFSVRFPNGSPVHRRWGRAYVLGWIVLASLGAVLGTGQDGVTVFAVLNVLGLTLVVIGMAAIALRNRLGPRWKRLHYRSMVISYGFVLAATANQILLRLGVDVPIWMFALIVAVPFGILIPVRRRLDATYRFSQATSMRSR